jgi:hypothetical protein
MSEQAIQHLDQPHLLADLMTVIEQATECDCYNRTCDYCVARKSRSQ